VCVCARYKEKSNLWRECVCIVCKREGLMVRDVRIHRVRECLRNIERLCAGYKERTMGNVFVRQVVNERSMCIYAK
jgi:hypothetical protein